jgi:hypothetical protein
MTILRPGPYAPADSAFFFAKRLRAISAAAAPPNNRIIGGAGTGSGPPDEPLDP